MDKLRARKKNTHICIYIFVSDLDARKLYTHAQYKHVREREREKEKKNHIMYNTTIEKKKKERQQAGK